MDLPVIPIADVAAGYPYGRSGKPIMHSRGGRHPVDAVRASLRTALRRNPCVLAFSGGRDSSLLLALAAELAAREGFEPPTALTLRYPGDAAADETSWQERVVEHLTGRGLRLVWRCRDIGGELDVIGPVMAPLLRAHGGPVWPPALAETLLLAREAAGGALVTGNFGDEVLGGHRASVLRTVAGLRGRGLSRADWRHAVTAAAPRLGDRLLLGDELSWLRPAFRRSVLRRRAAAAARPLRWEQSVLSALASRATVLGQLSRQRVAAGQDCALVEPFGDPQVIASYADHGRRLGAPGRAVATRTLAAGLLPDPVVKRRDKAYFNASRFGPASLQFGRSWSGLGVDLELVDADRLRAAWRAPVVPAATAMLLQQAWLATDGASA